jgi:hypothetical protein
MSLIQDILSSESIKDVSIPKINDNFDEMRKLTDVVALADAATILVDGAALGRVFAVTLGGNRTLGNPSGLTAAMDGRVIIFRVKQDGTGSRTLGYGSMYRFSTAVPSPTLSTAAGKEDYIGFIYNHAATKMDALAFNPGY